MYWYDYGSEKDTCGCAFLYSTLTSLDVVFISTCNFMVEHCLLPLGFLVSLALSYVEIVHENYMKKSIEAYRYTIDEKPPIFFPGNYVTSAIGVSD